MARTKKEVKVILDGYAKEYEALSITYPNKANLAELEIILSNANLAIASYNSLAAQKANETPDQEGGEAKKDETPPEEESAKITDEMVSMYKDELLTSFCGTFGDCSLDSPACSECGELMLDRQTLCLAVSAQAAESAPPKRTVRAGGNGKKSEYKEYIQNLIEAGSWTRKAIVDAFVSSFPEAAKSTVTTYLSDSQNVKYCAFPFICHIDKKTKIVTYTDKPAIGRSAHSKANGAT